MIPIQTELCQLHDATKGPLGRVIIKQKVIGGPDSILGKTIYLALSVEKAQDLAIHILMGLTPASELKRLKIDLERLSLEANEKE